jgi:hypothetical protein
MNRTGPRAVPPVSARAVPRVAPRSVPALVGASRVVVLSVGFFAPPDWDLVLRYIQEVHQGVVGWVDINEINLADNATRSWIDAQHAQMGRPAGASVRLGYYLFIDGQVSAYSSGLIDFKRDKVSLGVGIAATIAAMYWRSTALFGGAFHAARFQASIRVLQCFEAAISGQPPHATHQAPPQEGPIDEIELAFEVLGLAPSATQDEAKARFRALAKEWHPDRFAHNAPKSAEANVRMTQINVAYSVICEARRWC